MTSFGTFNERKRAIPIFWEEFLPLILVFCLPMQPN